MAYSGREQYPNKSQFFTQMESLVPVSNKMKLWRGQKQTIDMSESEGRLEAAAAQPWSDRSEGSAEAWKTGSLPVSEG